MKSQLDDLALVMIGQKIKTCDPNYFKWEQ